MNSNSVVITVEASFENELTASRYRQEIIEMIMNSVYVDGGRINKIEISDGTLKPLM